MYEGEPSHVYYSCIYFLGLITTILLLFVLLPYLLLPLNTPEKIQSTVILSESSTLNSTSLFCKGSLKSRFGTPSLLEKHRLLDHILITLFDHPLTSPPEWVGLVTPRDCPLPFLQIEKFFYFYTNNLLI